MANEVKLKLAIEGGKVVGAEIDGVNTKLDKLDGSARAAATGAGQLGAALGALATVGAALAVIKMADSVTTMRTQLNLSTGSAAEAGKAYTALFDIAQQGRVSFTELGTTFAAISRAGKELGVSQDRLLTVTRSISQAMTIGGGSAASMQAALVQLGQGLSSGVLRGEELNSIMEQTPRLAKAIADGLGVPIGKLRELGMAGQLTAEQVISALEKSGPALAKEMGSATLTVGQAFTMLSNSTVKFVGDADAASGASTTLAGALQTVSAAVDTVGTTINNNQAAFSAIVGGLAGVAAVAGVAALAGNLTKVATAVRAIGIAMAANPAILVMTGIVMAGGALVAVADTIAKSETILKASRSQLEGKIAAIDRRTTDSAQKISTAEKEKDAVLRQSLKEKLTGINTELAMMGTKDQADDSYNANEARRNALGLTASKARQSALDAFTASGKQYMSTAAKNQEKLNTEVELGQAALAIGAITAEQYAAQINSVTASFAKGGKSNKAAIDEAAQALKKSHEEQAERMKLGRQAAIDAGKAVQDENEAYQKSHDKVIDSLNRSADAVGNQVQKLQDEEAALAISADQHISLAQAIEQVEINRLQEARTMQLIANDDVAAKAIQREIDLRREAMGLIGNKEGRDANAKAATDMAADQKKAAEESGKYWEDALMRAFESGKGFFQSLWDTIKNTLKTSVLKVMIQGVMGSVGMGATGAAMAGQGGSAMSGLGIAGNLASMYSGVSGMVALGSQVVAGTMSVANALGTVAANATGTGISGLLATNGAYGTAAASSASGIAGGLTSTLAAIPVWGWAALAAVAVASIFGGRGDVESKGKGIEGNFGGTGFTGNSYASYAQDGGWFHSDRNWTDRTALDATTSNALSAGFGSLKASATGAALALGLSTASIANYSEAIKVTLTDDATKNNEIITKMMGDLGDHMASAVAPGLAAFAKAGETASVTLSRLGGSITTANAWISMLRNRLFDVSMAGADAASKLADAFGSLDNLAASSKAYYETYYTEAERTVRSSEDLAKAMALVNVVLPDTKDAFRAVVTSLDLTTDSGRNAYAVLLALAPEYAATADATAKLAKEIADKLMTTFTGNGQLIPALNAAALKVGDFTGSSIAMAGELSYINSIMGDSTSAVIGFRNGAYVLGTSLSDSQLSAGLLNNQIVALQGNADKTRIDFAGLGIALLGVNPALVGTSIQTANNYLAGLNPLPVGVSVADVNSYLRAVNSLPVGASVEQVNAALRGVDTVTFVTTIGLVFDNLATRISGVIDSISTERIAVREAALSIINPTVMGKAQIQAGIAGVNTGLPSNAGVVAANASLKYAEQAQSQQASSSASTVSLYQGVLDGTKKTSADLATKYTGLSKWFIDLQKQYGNVYANATYTGAFQPVRDALQYNAGTNRISGYAGGNSTTWGDWGWSDGAGFNNALNNSENSSKYSDLYYGNNQLASAEKSTAAWTEALAQVTQQQAALQTSAATATATAQDAAKKAVLDYAAAMQSFVIDASKSVGKLSKLREETVKYYEAQKQLADLMSTSAAGLRTTVANYRYAQQAPADQLAALQSQFSSAYDLARSTSGDTMAGYGDKLNALLPTLIDKLAETGKSNLISSYLAQAESVASLIEAAVPVNYQLDSLTMLGSIDATLAALDASSQSAEKIISDAVNAGSDKTAAGLRAIVQQLGGVPAFAAGGAHTGGARWVGENGPEIEVTGPSRIFNAAQLRGMGGSGGNTARLEALVERQAQQLEAMSYELRAIAQTNARLVKLADRAEQDGTLVRTNSDTPLATVAA